MRIKVNVTEQYINSYPTPISSTPGVVRVYNPIRAAVRDLSVSHPHINTDFYTEVNEDFIRVTPDLTVKTPWRVRTKLKQFKAGKKITPFSFWIDTGDTAKPAAKTISITITEKTVDKDPSLASDDCLNCIAVQLYSQCYQNCDTAVTPETTTYGPVGGKLKTIPTPPKVAEFLRKLQAGEPVELPATFEFPNPEVEEEEVLEVVVAKITGDTSDFGNPIACALYFDHKMPPNVEVGEDLTLYGYDRNKLQTIPTPKEAREWLKLLRTNPHQAKEQLPITFRFPKPKAEGQLG